MTQTLTQRTSGKKVCMNRKNRKFCSRNLETHTSVIPTKNDIRGVIEDNERCLLVFKQPYETRDVLDFLKTQYELEARTPTTYERTDVDNSNRVCYTVMINSTPIFRLHGPAQGTKIRGFYLDVVSPDEIKDNYSRNDEQRMREKAIDIVMAEEYGDKPHDKPHYHIHNPLNPRLSLK